MNNHAARAQKVKLLITGASGVLGLGLAEAFQVGGVSDFAIVVAGRQQVSCWEGLADFRQVDLLKPNALISLVDEINPQILIHAAAISSLIDCRIDPERALQINANCLSGLERFPDLTVIGISSDQVFNGQEINYSEDAIPSPVHFYGETKVAMEQLVKTMGGVVVRLPLLLGAAAQSGKAGADFELIRKLQAGENVNLFCDEFRTPLSSRAAGAVLVDLLSLLVTEKKLAGVFHFAGAECVSRFELGKAICEYHHLDQSLLQSSYLSEFSKTPRPPRLSLKCERAQNVLSWRPPNLRQCLDPKG